MDVLNHQMPNMDEKEKDRLSIFLSDFEDIPFKRQVFEELIKLSTRNAQLRISDLIEKDILEKLAGKGYKYQVNKNQWESGRQGINLHQFMELPGPVDESFMLEKNLEAMGIIENSRGLFISDNDSRNREAFLGALGSRLKENHDIIYFSFQKLSLDDFISACIEHLSELNMDGWFRNMNDDKLELKEKVIGLSGSFIQSLSRHRKTVIILEGIDVFSTGESQALIE